MNHLAIISIVANLASITQVAAISNGPLQSQIAQAVSPLPASLRPTATVISYDAKGEPVVLRRGTNNIFCIPNQPGGKGFTVRCYAKILRAQRDMEGRLRAVGKDAREIQLAVEAAIESGKLPRPPTGTTRYARVGNTESDARTFWIVLMPGATIDASGLPIDPGQGTPWLVQAGTQNAYIMIPE